MSASLPKMSNIIYSNNLCYYKIPLDYNESTDTHKYTFTVAAGNESGNYDSNFNTHAFNMGRYLPECAPDNIYYKKVAVISGTKDIFSVNNRGITIQTPIGFVKNKDDNVFSNEELPEEELSTTVVGFTGNSALFGEYQYIAENIIGSDTYHAGLTGYYGDESDYWTFISRVSRPLTSEGDVLDGFYVFGCTSIKMSPSEVYLAVSNAFNSSIYNISTAVLNSGKYAQMYYIDGSSFKIPSNLPTNEFLSHTGLVSNALVLWEQQVAFPPNPFWTKSSDPKTNASRDYLKIQNLNSKTVSKIDCYIQPSSSSAIVGSLSTNNEWYLYYDVRTVYNSSGGMDVWLRIGDPDSGNNCWIKYTSSGSTVFTQTYSQSEFNFRMNNEVENYDAFNWQYTVITNANNASYSPSNSYFSKTVWSDFTWDVHGPDYTLVNAEGKYLTATLNGTALALTFEEDFSDHALWNIVTNKNTGGIADSWYIANKVAVTGVNRRCINHSGSLFNAPACSTSTVVRLYAENDSSFKLLKHSDATDWFVQSGVRLIVASPNSAYALGNAVNGSNLSRVAVTIDGETLTYGDVDISILTAEIYEDNQYLSDIIGESPTSSATGSQIKEILPSTKTEQSTWFIAPPVASGTNFNNAYSVLYIKATTADVSNLMPYKISYLDADVSTDSMYLGRDSNGKYTYIFKYIIPYTQPMTFYNSEGNQIATISQSKYSSLNIKPIITDNKVQIYANVSYDSDKYPTVKPTDVGYLVFRRVIDEASNKYEYGVNDKFARGSLIEVTGVAKNGWKFEGVVGDSIFTLPTNENYEVYVVTGNFSRKDDNIDVYITNTDTSLGTLVAGDEMAGKLSEVITSGNEVTYHYRMAEDDYIYMKAEPINDYNLGTLSKWEYLYNKSAAEGGGTEWRVIGNEKDAGFKIHLYQKEGISMKSEYRYKAVWGRTCILY